MYVRPALHQPRACRTYHVPWHTGLLIHSVPCLLGPQVSGIVQTALYIDVHFFYTYINAKKKRIDAPIELECDV